MPVDLATLILAPLCIGLLLLYLQQVAKTHGLHEERKSLLKQIAEANNKIAADAEHYNKAIVVTEQKYKEEIHRKEKDIDMLNRCFSSGAFVEEYNRRISHDDIIPGSDAGS